MYDARLVAGHILESSNGRGVGVSNLKLQKLLYFVQAEFLVSQSSPCFSDGIEAWDIGPVVPSVYFLYRIYGRSSIPPGAPCWRPPVGSSFASMSEDDKLVVDRMVESLDGYSSSALAKVSMAQRPWVVSHAFGNGSLITNRSIRDFFADGRE